MTNKTLTDILKHWYYVNRTYINLFGIKSYLRSRCYRHDLDKVIPVIFGFYDKKIHKANSKHHWEKMFCKGWKTRDTREMIADWESSRFSKANKQLNAVDYFKTIKDNLSEIKYQHICTQLAEAGLIFYVDVTDLSDADINLFMGTNHSYSYIKSNSNIDKEF